MANCIVIVGPFWSLPNRRGKSLPSGMDGALFRLNLDHLLIQKRLFLIFSGEGEGEGEGEKVLPTCIF